MSNSTTPRQTMIALLACVLCGVSGAAQEQPFVNENAAPAETRAVQTQRTTDKTVTDPTMPDITGTWRVKIVSPDIPTGPLVEMEIRRVPNGFQIDNPWTEDTKRISVRWWEGRGRFEGSWEADGDRHKMTLQPLADFDTLRVVVANRLNQSAKEASKTSGPEDKSIGNLSTQDWTRISKSLSTTFPEKRYGMPETLVSSEPDNRRSRTDSREVRAIPDTAAAKQLVEQLAAQESAAASEAATIRQLQSNGQAARNKQPIAEHQRKLKNLLSTAFDLKLQLEVLQVKELQSRLSRLELQIGQRKELREKIIARRAGELIEGDTLKWDSTGAASRSAAETSSKSKPTNPTTKPVASAELTTQIHFSGPKGMEVSIGDKPEKLIAPARHTFLRHANDPQRYDIAFTKASDDPDRCFLALLDIFPITPETEGFLRHNAVPITITEQDAHHASGTLMIKAIYLPKPSSVQTAIPEIKSVASWSISGDVIEAANQFGTILAVLRLSTNVDQLGKLEPRMSDAAITRPQSSTERNVTQQVTIDFPMANFPVIPGDRIEVQHLLHAEEGFHGPAKILASGLEVVGVARSLSTPTRTGLTLATTPEMAAMLEQSATTGLLFCHPLDPVVMLPCGRVVRIPLGIRQEGRLTVGDAVQVDRMSLAIGESNLAEPKFTGFATGLLIGFEHEDIPEGTTAPTSIVKLLLPKDSNIDAHVFQNRVDELIRDGTLFRGEMRERGDTTLFHTAVTEIEWQIESLEKRIAYYQAQVIDNAASAKAQLNLGLQRIRLGQLKAQRALYKTSADVMARVRPLKSEANSPTPGAAIPSPPIFRSLDE